ncbi:hypothetical protein BKA57DRAFT_448321 [Linnemannia elongata]|nr:hypothetical protein BKA57DRAFT_448321 [Linnemannia elongata]
MLTSSASHIAFLSVFLSLSLSLSLSLTLCPLRLLAMFPVCFLSNRWIKQHHVDFPQQPNEQTYTHTKHMAKWLPLLSLLFFSKARNR